MMVFLLIDTNYLTRPQPSYDAVVFAWLILLYFLIENGIKVLIGSIGLSIG
jgi:hypothetical protein